MAPSSNDRPCTDHLVTGCPDCRPQPSGYSAEVQALDVALDIRISEIRAALDSGAVTVREAAGLRVAALERHLAAVKALRAEYFGNGE